MKKVTLSKNELEILILFALSMIPQITYLKMSCSQLLGLYLIGMTFEFITNDAWQYNPKLHKSTFTLQDRDINLIFGLGWIGSLVFGMSMGKFLASFFPAYEIVCYMLSIGVIGNLIEELFLLLGLWQYNTKNWIITIWTNKPIMIGRIPLAVRMGYFLIMGILVPWIIGQFTFH